MMRRMVLWPFLASCWAFSSTSLQSYKIIGIQGTGTQLLPRSYVDTSFQQWTLDNDGRIIVHTQAVAAWQPTLGVVIKSGVAAYVLIGLRSNQQDWHLAHQWMSMSTMVEPNMRAVVYAGEANGVDDRIARMDAEQVRSALEVFGQASAECNALAQGFHIVHVPLGEPLLLPTSATTLSLVLTAEPDARELFTIDEGLVEMTASSVLHVDVASMQYHGPSRWS